MADAKGNISQQLKGDLSKLTALEIAERVTAVGVAAQAGLMMRSAGAAVIEEAITGIRATEGIVDERHELIRFMRSVAGLLRDQTVQPVSARYQQRLQSILMAGLDTQ